MGKRKKLDDRVGTPPPPPPPDGMACTSGIESSSRKKFSPPEFEGHKPFSPTASIMDSSWDRVIARSSPAHYRNNLRRSMLLKRSRNRHGHHYWRNSGVHSNPSTSYGKVAPQWDEKLSVKLDRWQNSDHPPTTVLDNDRSFVRQERITPSSSLLDDPELFPCPICAKLLRRKPYLMGSVSCEHSVVAVLVCGHTYHADCLDQETPIENKSDPQCPICLGSLNAVGEDGTE